MEKLEELGYGLIFSRGVGTPPPPSFSSLLSVSTSRRGTKHRVCLPFFTTLRECTKSISQQH